MEILLEKHRKKIKGERVSGNKWIFYCVLEHRITTTKLESGNIFGRDLFPCLRIRLDEGRLGMKNDTERAPGLVSRKSPKLFRRISGVIILFVSSKRRRLEARNLAVMLIFIRFTTCKQPHRIKALLH